MSSKLKGNIKSCISKITFTLFQLKTVEKYGGSHLVLFLTYPVLNAFPHFNSNVAFFFIWRRQSLNSFPPCSWFLNSPFFLLFVDLCDDKEVERLIISYWAPFISEIEVSWNAPFFLRLVLSFPFPKVFVETQNRRVWEWRPINSLLFKAKILNFQPMFCLSALLR